MRVSGALEITSGSGILANRGGIVGGNAVKGGGVIVYAVCNIYAASVARSGVLGYKPVNSFSDRAVVEIKTGAVRCAAEVLSAETQ